MQNFKWKSSVTMIHHYISFNEIEKFSISALFFDLYEFYNSDFLFPGKIFNEIQWDGFITSSQEKYSIQSCRVSPSKWKSSTRCTLTGIFQWKLKVNGTTNLLQKWFWMKLKRKNQNFVKIILGNRPLITIHCKIAFTVSSFATFSLILSKFPQRIVE